MPAQLSENAENPPWIPAVLRIKAKPSLSNRLSCLFWPCRHASILSLHSGHTSWLAIPRATWTVPTWGPAPAHPYLDTLANKGGRSRLQPQSPVGPTTGRNICFFPEAAETQRCEQNWTLRRGMTERCPNLSPPISQSLLLTETARSA